MFRVCTTLLLMIAALVGCGGGTTGRGDSAGESVAQALRATTPNLPSPAVARLAVDACAAGTMSACRMRVRAQQTAPLLTVRAQQTAPLLTLEPSAAFQWAERALPDLFGPPSVGGTPPVSDGPYLYRYYFGTWNYLGFAGRSVYVMGPATGGQLVLMGQIDDYACRIAPIACSAAAAPILANLEGQSFLALSAIAARPPSAGSAAKVVLSLASGPELILPPNADDRYVLPLVAERTQALLTVQNAGQVLYRAALFIEPPLEPVPAGAVVRGYLRASIQVGQEALALIPTSDSAGRAALQERLSSLRETLDLVSQVMEKGSVGVGSGTAPITVADLRLQDLVLGYALRRAAPAQTALAAPLKDLSAEDRAFGDAVRALASREYANNLAQAGFTAMGAIGTFAVIAGVVVASPVALTAGTAIGLVAVGGSLVSNVWSLTEKTLYGDVSGFSRKDEIVGSLTALASLPLQLGGISAGIEAEAQRLVLGMNGSQYPLLSKALEEVTKLGWSEAIAAGLGSVADLVKSTPQPVPGASSPSDPTPARGCKLQADGSGLVYVSGAADSVWHTITYLPLGPRPLVFVSEGNYWAIDYQPGESLGCQSRWTYLDMFCVYPDGSEQSAPTGLWGYSWKCSAPAVGYRARAQVSAMCAVSGVKVETISTSDQRVEIGKTWQDFTCR